STSKLSLLEASISLALDIALVNSYLLARAIMPKTRHRRDYQKFQEPLAMALMSYSKVPEHNQIYSLIGPTGRNNQLNWQPRHQGRAFGADITNIGGSSRGQFRGSRTQWGRDQCNLAL